MSTVRRPRVAVVGHAEWVTHVRGDFPAPGNIAIYEDGIEEPGGGGAVAAAQVARLGAECLFITALGDDDTARRTREVLVATGMQVRVAVRPAPQTRSVSAVGDLGDRSITVLGGVPQPQINDDLGWSDLVDYDAVYFVGEDPETLVACRRAPLLVVTARSGAALGEASVRADVLVGSSHDDREEVEATSLPVTPAAEVWTEGRTGGWWRENDTPIQHWNALSPTAPPVDSYGCGDSFAAGLTVGLARGWDLARAIHLGALCGAACVTGRGGLGTQRVEP